MNQIKLSFIFFLHFGNKYSFGFAIVNFLKSGNGNNFCLIKGSNNFSRFTGTLHPAAIDDRQIKQRHGFLQPPGLLSAVLNQGHINPRPLHDMFYITFRLSVAAYI